MRFGFSTKVGKKSRVYVAPGGGKSGGKKSGGSFWMGLLYLALLGVVISLLKNHPWLWFVLIAAVIALIVRAILRKKARKAAALASQAAEAAKAAAEAAEAERIQKLREEKAAAFAAALEAIPSAEITVADVAAARQPLKDMDEFGFSAVTARTNRDKLNDFVAIDVETTGLSPDKCEIIEVAAIRFVDWQPVEKFVTLCRPKKPIPEEATAINGIYDEMVEDKPLFGQIAASLQEFIGKDNLVGHNLTFDLRFLWKHGVDLFEANDRRKFYDTYQLGKSIVKDCDNYKLGTLCNWFGIWMDTAHRAEADAYASGLLLEKLAAEREPVSNLDTKK